MINKICQSLSEKIKSAYEAGLTMEEAEKLSGEFLYGMTQVADALRDADLDTRMRKTGLKAIKAAIYLEEAKKTDKKPSDVMLAALVDCNDLVAGEQEGFDAAESSKDHLQNYYNIFKEAHVYFRGIAKGRFE